MSYFSISELHKDDDFRGRIGACAQTEERVPNVSGAVEQWVADYAWEIASAPGFGDAYESAVVGGIERPGADPAVITDAMILSAVQAIPLPEPPIQE